MRVVKEVKEATMGMMVTRGPTTMAAMELVATMAVTMGPVMSQAMMVTQMAMTTTGPATMMWLVAGGYDGASDYEDEWYLG